MPHTDSQQPTTAAGPVFTPEPPTPTTCSFSECSKGHRWTPKVAVVGCPGCQAPTLVTLMQQCPVCNEPASKTTLRTEHVSQAMGVQATCKGERPHGESGVIVSDRAFYKATEAELLPARVESE